MSAKATAATTSGSQPVSPVFYVIIALLVIVISFLLSKRFKKSFNVVLFVGLSDAGKTTLFTRIVFNKSRKCVTSLKENEATLEDLKLQLIDLPGAERLRPRMWDQYREKARHVMFVIDSTTVTTKLRDLSEYLYTLISDPIIEKNNIEFSIVCHKQDLPDAIKCQDLKVVLEKELTAIKKTKKGQLGRTSNEETEDRLATLSNDQIDLDRLKVQLVETSINNIDQMIKTIL